MVRNNCDSKIKSPKSRDGFSDKTKRAIALRVGGECCFPGCKAVISGPSTNPEAFINVGVAAHIYAASEGGPRFNSAMTPQQRKSAKNGILFCQNHAKIVDNDPERYTAEILLEWKLQKEKKVDAKMIGQKLSLIENLKLEISFNTIKMDGYRHEYFLNFSLINQGKELITGYYAEIEMPAPVILQAYNNGYLSARSTPDTAFFRKPPSTDILYPGDTQIIQRIQYYVDSCNYQNHRILKTSVKCRVYLPEGHCISEEKQFYDLQCF